MDTYATARPLALRLCVVCVRPTILPVEPRIGPTRGFGLTPGELLTISKPNPYPKSEKPPARKWFSKSNL